MHFASGKRRGADCCVIFNKIWHKSCLFPVPGATGPVGPPGEKGLSGEKGKPVQIKIQMINEMHFKVLNYYIILYLTIPSIILSPWQCIALNGAFILTFIWPSTLCQVRAWSTLPTGYERFRSNSFASQ